MTGKKSPSCVLCERDGPPTSRKVHGVSLSFGLADFACPTTREEYERAVLECIRWIPAVGPDKGEA